MIHKVITLFLFAFFTNITAQKVSVNPEIKVEYEASLQLGQKYKHNQNFILIGNSSDYYFAGIQNYMNDSGIHEVKGVDLQAISDYFQERLIQKDGNSNVFVRIASTKIMYQEKAPIKWVLYSDTKIINGIKCQMAATNKYGRRWIAYFSKEYPQAIGPWKFNGLPGLIFEIYDTKDDYHFTLVKVQKYTTNFEFKLGDYKNYTKQNYLKAKYNMEFTVAPFAKYGGEFLKEAQKIVDDHKQKYNNPLEIKPIE